MSGLAAADLEARVTGLMERLRAGGPPSDLRALALARRVRRVVLQDMIPRGGIAPLKDGFEIFLRNRERWELDLNEPDGLDRLNKRQRFTFAHELAHTFFFDLNAQPPKEIKGVPRWNVLEPACDQAAAVILVPHRSLRSHVRAAERFSAELTLDVARVFGVSLEVALRRLAIVREFDNEPVGLVLVARGPSGHSIVRAVCFRTALRSFLQPPQRYQRLEEWCSAFKVSSRRDYDVS